MVDVGLISKMVRKSRSCMIITSQIAQFVEVIDGREAVGIGYDQHLFRQAALVSYT